MTFVRRNLFDSESERGVESHTTNPSEMALLVTEAATELSAAARKSAHSWRFPDMRLSTKFDFPLL